MHKACHSLEVVISYDSNCLGVTGGNPQDNSPSVYDRYQSSSQESLLLKCVCVIVDFVGTQRCINRT